MAAHDHAPAPAPPEDDGRWIWFAPLGVVIVAGLLALPALTAPPPAAPAAPAPAAATP